MVSSEIPHVQSPGSEPLLTITWDSVIGTERLGYNHDTDEVDEIPLTLGASVADLIARRLIDGMRSDVRKAVLDSVTETIQAEVRDIVRGQLDGTVRQTNQWGEPQGEPQTLRTLLGKQVQEYLNEKPRDNRQGYSAGYAKPGGFRELVEGEVDAALTKELRGVIAQARKDVVGKVQGKATALIAEAIK